MRKDHRLEVLPLFLVSILLLGSLPAWAEGELALGGAGLSGKTVTVTVTNTTSQSVTGRVTGTYDDGAKPAVQKLAAGVALHGGQSATVTLTFGGRDPVGIIDDVSPFPQVGYVILGCIIDDVEPF